MPEDLKNQRKIAKFARKSFTRRLQTGKNKLWTEAEL